MPDDDPPSEWDRPLTKREFFSFQLQKQADIYSALGYLFFVVSLILVGYGVHGFIAGDQYLGIDKIVLALLSFLGGREAYRRFGDVRKEQRRIEGRPWRSD